MLRLLLLPACSPQHLPVVLARLLQVVKIVAKVELGCSMKEEQEVAAALASHAEESVHRAALIAAGGIPALVRLLHSADTGVQQHAAGALKSLAADDAHSKAAIAAAGGIPALVPLLGSSSMGVQVRGS